MGTAQTIKAGIASLIASNLGDHTELIYGLDIQKNKLLGGTKAYAITPAEVDQLSGVTGYVTVNQLFEVVLTDSFAPAKLSDADQQSAAVTLFGRMETLYKEIKKNKAGVPTVMNVSSLSIARPEFLDSNVAVLRATMTIQYRTAL